MKVPTITFLLAITYHAALGNAQASVPSPFDSDIPCGINLVGLTNTLRADPVGEFQFVIRTFAHHPMAGVQVEIVFGGCAPDIEVCRDQPGTGSTSPVSVACEPGGVVVRAVTDANGVVKLALIGNASNSHSGSPAAGWKCAMVYADGVNMGDLNVGCYDQNGSLGANPADASIWSSDNFDDDYEGRSDLNCTHSINPVDLSLILNNFSSVVSCSNYCN